MTLDEPLGADAARHESVSLVIDDCWRRIGVRGDRSCPELEQHFHCRNCPTYEAIARDLLDRPLPPGYAAEWALHFAADAGRDGNETGEPETIETVVIFRLGDEWLALSTAVFEEVAEPRPIHSLPHRRDGMVLGLVNVRGELIVCISLFALLGTRESPRAERSGQIKAFRRLVVLGRDERRVAFEVDEVFGIHRLAAKSRMPLPATLDKAAANFASALIDWQGHAVGRLDEARLLDMIDRSIA